MYQEKNYVGRKFGYCRVYWKILNYCVTPRGDDWTFESPDFYIRGFQLTKWKMRLRRIRHSKEDYTVLFELERLMCSCSYLQGLADCVLKYHDDVGNVKKIEFKYAFVVNSKFEKELTNTSLIPRHSPHFDRFTLTCEILFHFQNVEETLSPCNDLGIRQLSEDLHRLYLNRWHSDLTLEIAGTDVEVHKPILYYRIPEPVLKMEMCEADEIEVDACVTAEAFGTVAEFLYTANMKYAVTEPSLAIAQCALNLCVKPINAYYYPDDLNVYTTVQVEKFKLMWSIDDFYRRNEKCLVSPQMTNEIKDASWRLKVYPKGFGSKRGHVGAFLEIEVRTPKEICVEISLAGVFEEGPCYSNHKRTEGREIFGDKNFVEYGNLKNYLKNDSLTIELKLRMPTGEESCSIGTSHVSYEFFSEQLNYACLSKDMLSLYRSPKFSDWKLEVWEGMQPVHVHKSILYARCPSLYDAFGGEIIKQFIGGRLTVLTGLLFFLYCGKLDERMYLRDMFRCYEIAEHFQVTALKQAIIDKLQRSLSEVNAKLVYEFADKNNVIGLKDFARQYITDTSTDVGHYEDIDR